MMALPPSSRAQLLAEAQAAQAAGDLPAAAFGYAAVLQTYPPDQADSAVFALRLERATCLHGAGDYSAESVELDHLALLADQLADPVSQVRVMLRRAALQILVGSLRDAEYLAAEAFTVAHRLGDLGLIGEALVTRCDAAYCLGDTATAQRHANAALATFQMAANQRGEARARRMLGLTFIHTGQHREGLAHLYRSLELCRVHDDRTGEALALNAIGISTDDRAVARAVFQQGLTLAEQLGDRESEALLANNLAIIYVSLGLYGQARAYTGRAVHLARRLGTSELLASFLETLGRAYGGAGLLEASRHALDEALALAEHLDSRESIAITLICLGRTDLAEGRFAAAAQHLERAIMLCSALGRVADLATAYAWRSAVHLALGELRHALATSTEAGTLADQVEIGGEFPLQEVWWHHYRALQATPSGPIGGSGVDHALSLGSAHEISPVPEALASLRKAREVMYAAIVNLSDPGLRRSYLGRVAINRTILETLAAYDELGLPPVVVSSYASVEDRLTRMLGVTARLNELRNAESLREMFLDEVVELSGAERVLLVLGASLDQAEHQLGRGLDPAACEALCQEVSPLLREALQRRQGLLHNAHDPTKPVEPLDLAVRSAVVVPLISGAQPVGVLYADVRSFFGAFGRGDLDLIGILAAQAATALENTQLYMQTLQAKHALERDVAARTADLQAANHTLVVRATEAQAAHAAAEAASASKSTFLANVSHELRTPLNAVIGFAQILQHDPQLGTRQRELVQIIVRSGDHLLGLINDVLELTKIDAGRLAISPAPFDLHRLLHDLEGLFRLRAETRQIQFRISLDPALPRVVIGDEGRLRQVLINLLSNAFKFTASGMIRVEATFDGQAEPPRVQLAVSDTGEGIASSELGELFQPFVQTASGRQAKEGTGLGLALSRQLARLMGGDIQVRSVPGQGSTFTVTVRLDPAGPSALNDQEVKVLGLNMAGRRYRVLVALSRAHDRHTFSAWLRTAGLEARTASDGSEAHELWHTWRPHLLLLETGLSVLSGYTLAAQIKATPAGRSCVIILLGSEPDEPLGHLRGAPGCDDALPLATDHDQLLRMIALHLGLDLRQAEPRSTELGPLSSADLAALPATLRHELAQAAAISDPALVEAIVNQIRAGWPALGARIQALADEFQFDVLERLAG